MKQIYCSAFLCIIFFLSGCVAFQVGGEVQRGRMALLRDEPKVALLHFQRAAELEPNYLVNFSPLTEGVWTYTGRAYYEMKRFTEARKAFERALLRAEQDHFARLYLGLVLGRNGNQRRGVQEIEAALRGFHSQLEYLEQYHSDGRFWDATRVLRSEMERDLKMISAKEVRWPELISSGEWLGRTLEEEIDLSKRLQQFEETRDGNTRETSD